MSDDIFEVLIDKLLARDWLYDQDDLLQRLRTDCPADQVYLLALPFDEWHNSDEGYMRLVTSNGLQPLPEDRVAAFGDMLVGFYLDDTASCDAELEITYGECRCPNILLRRSIRGTGGSESEIVPVLDGRYAAPILCTPWSVLRVTIKSDAKPWAIYAYLDMDPRRQLAVMSGVAVPNIGIIKLFRFEKHEHTDDSNSKGTWPSIDRCRPRRTEAARKITNAIVKYLYCPDGPMSYKAAKSFNELKTSCTH